MAWDWVVDIFGEGVFHGIGYMLAKNKKGVRVRIAPSPTGYLHIGTARTALFNLLFARHLGGTFILRIEDTDVERSTKEFEKDIIDGLAWLGLEHDEGPYRQRERLGVYQKHLEKLLAEHKAYYCFCTKDELDAQRQSQEAAGQAPKYSGKCRSVTDAEAQRRRAAGEACVIRLKIAPEKIRFTDLIRGQLEFDNALSGDIVIAKSLTEPLYNFAVVVDDADMQISHVIRGEDHIANTPKQIAISDALGCKPVQYAHLPLILNADRSKMSKRFNATSVSEYRKKGYVPEAMINFLALLGWHPVHDTEMLSREQIIKEFDIERVQKGGAVFNQQKLDFFNAHYLKQLPVGRLVSLLEDDLFSEPAWREDARAFERAVIALRDRLVTLADFRTLAKPFFDLPEYPVALLTWKKGTPENAKQNLERCHELLRELPEQLFTVASLQEKLTALADQYGRGDVFWPLRVALSGSEQSPPPAELAAALGKREALERIAAALRKYTT